MNLRYLAIVMMGLLSVSALARGDGLVRLPQGKNSVVVPLQRAGHLLLVKPRINGQEAGWFVVDTGGQMTTVSPKTSQLLNLPAAGQAVVTGITGSRLTTFRSIQSLAIGDLTMGPHQVVENDLSALSNSIGVELAGILGGSLWKTTPFAVDYAQPALIFYDAAHFVPPAGAAVISLQIDQDRPAIHATVGKDEQGTFVLDTAFTRFMCIPAGFVRKHEDLFASTAQRIGVEGASGGEQAALASAHTVSALGRSFADAQVQVVGGGESLQGLFGDPMLRQFFLTFDYAGGKLYAAPRKIPPLADRLAGGLKVNAADAAGITLLHLAAVDDAQSDAETLLAAGADPKAADALGRTPLHDAAAIGAVQIAKLLLAKGADLKARTHAGLTPLLIAAQNFQTETALMLLQNGADANAADSTGVTSLMYAALNGDQSLLEALLKSGADARAKNNQGQDALGAAAIGKPGNDDAKQARIIDLLLAAKADPNARDGQGATALIYAAFSGRSACAQTLLHAGADPNITTFRGESALAIAQSLKHQSVVTLLKSAPATHPAPAVP